MHADPEGPCAVSSLVETPGCSPVEGRVVWDPAHSIWNEEMRAAALILGPLTVSPSTAAVFVLPTGGALYPGQADWGFRFIQLLERLGQAWDVRTPETMAGRRRHLSGVQP